MKLFSWVLFFMFLSSNSSGQIDSLFWSNRLVKQIRTYSEVDNEKEPTIQFVHSIDYYTTGNKKEESNCTHTLLPINENGEGIFDSNCTYLYWDDFGNEMDQPLSK